MPAALDVPLVLDEQSMCVFHLIRDNGFVARNRVDYWQVAAGNAASIYRRAGGGKNVV